MDNQQISDLFDIDLKKFEEWSKNDNPQKNVEIGIAIKEKLNIEFIKEFGGRIKCIFFSEFEKEKGPQIIFKIPDNFATNFFENVHEYIITKHYTCGKLLSMFVKILKCI